MFESLPKDYIVGFVSGSLATLLGFVLTILWDSYKYYRDRKKRDRAILEALRLEVIGNIGLLRENQDLVKRELEFVKEKKSIVQPLAPLHEHMWQVLAMNMPDKLIDTPKLLTSVREAIEHLLYVSEIVESREAYRINNGSMSNYSDRIRIYDELLQSHIPKAIQKLEFVVQRL